MAGWKNVITIAASTLTIIGALALLGGFVADWPRLYRAWSGMFGWAGWQVSAWLVLYSLLSSGALLALLSAQSLLRRELPHAWRFAIGCLAFLPAHLALSFLSSLNPGAWVLYQMIVTPVVVALAMDAGLFRRQAQKEDTCRAE